jgi:hypothetical protein
MTPHTHPQADTDGDKVISYDEFYTFALTAGEGQGLTLVSNSAQLELFCPPYNPT